jgi:hypothetical protein
LEPEIGQKFWGDLVEKKGGEFWEKGEDLRSDLGLGFGLKEEGKEAAFK